MNMTTRLRPTALAVLATATLAWGCGGRDTVAENNAGDTGTLAPVITTIDDDRIVAAIRSDYFQSDQVKARDIDVSSQGGVVTLSGAVPSDDVRQTAVSLAEKVDGVDRVNNQLRVGDQTQTDAASEGTRDAGWVTTKILAQYYVNPQLKPWNIDVSTSRDGIVTLDGRIDNDADRAEAVRIARATEGVQDVRDKLRAGDVAATSGDANARGSSDSASNALSDGWITTKIQSRFFLDPDVKGRNINIDTKDGVVVLKGTVGSYSARRQAVGIARNSDGVREVRDELRVEAGRDDAARTSTAAATASGAIDDTWITTKIRSKYFMDGDVQASRIEVATRNGVVTLTGTVGSKAAKDAAAQLARDTEGVRRVRDQLTLNEATTSQH